MQFTTKYTDYSPTEAHIRIPVDILNFGTFNRNIKNRVSDGV